MIVVRLHILAICDYLYWSRHAAMLSCRNGRRPAVLARVRLMRRSTKAANRDTGRRRQGRRQCGSGNRYTRHAHYRKFTSDDDFTRLLRRSHRLRRWRILANGRRTTDTALLSVFLSVILLIIPDINVTHSAEIICSQRITDCAAS